MAKPEKIHTHRLILDMPDGKQFVWEFDKGDIRRMEILSEFTEHPHMGSRKIAYVGRSNRHQITLMLNTALHRPDLGGNYYELKESVTEEYREDTPTSIFWTCKECCLNENPEELIIGDFGPRRCVLCEKERPRDEMYALPNHPGLFPGSNETLRLTPAAMVVLSKAARSVSGDNAYSLWMDFFREVRAAKIKPIKTTIRNCARCQGIHEDLIFEPLKGEVIETLSGNFTHWAMCPVTQQPIVLMKVTGLSKPAVLSK